MGDSDSPAAADASATHEVLLLLGLGALPSTLRASLSDAPLQVVPDSFMGPPAGVRGIQSPLGQIHEPLYEGSEDWAPRPIGGLNRWERLIYDDDRVRDYHIVFVHTWMVGVKYAGLVAGVRVGFNGALDDCVTLKRGVLFARNRITLTKAEVSEPLDLYQAIVAGIDLPNEDARTDLAAKFRATRDFRAAQELARLAPLPGDVHDRLVTLTENMDMAEWSALVRQLVRTVEVHPDSITITPVVGDSVSVAR